MMDVPRGELGSIPFAFTCPIAINTRTRDKIFFIRFINLITAHKTARHKRLLQEIKKYKRIIYVTFFRNSVAAEKQTG